jgi:trans-aconitate methyltransferase
VAHPPPPPPSLPDDDPLRGPADIDITVAHSARVYDYLLGGTDNFAVDREAAELQAAAIGGVERTRLALQAQRAFLGRSMRYLAGDEGIRQFLDLGTGIPSSGNVHEVVQEVAPEARVVYVDNDPVVLAHAHSLLKDAPDTTAYVDGDLRDVESILTRAAATLDFDQPVAVVLVAVLHLFRDADDPWGIVARLAEALPTGSYLVMSHLTGDFVPEPITNMAHAIPRSARFRFNLRSRDSIARFFDGVELVEPGLVRVDRWRPDGPRQFGPEGCVIAAIYGGVGRKG